jgi:hypothetical protein
MLKSSEYIANAEGHARTEAHHLLKSVAAKIRHRVPNVIIQAIAMRGDARHELVRKVCK